MNQVIQQLKERKSVRVFTDREIASEEVSAILEAAVNAPTAGNQQLYTIINVTDPQLKARLAESCDDQSFIATAPLVLVFCADCRKWYNSFLEYGCEPRKPGVGDLMLAVSDTNIAAQNAVVAAQSLGIGSCYIGDIMENAEQQRQLLSLPPYVFPAAMLVFGYPTEAQLERPKPPRSEMAYIVHENGYRDMDARELKQMLSVKAGVRNFEEWIQAFCNRKYNSDFSREMTRSVQVFLEDFRE
ncbi:MAG: nitroreductase family protein [Oscillospiraceae bacterium]|nr:nitroreductase family protein [Oscillospiraceae bacterium]